jgi:predicted amidohydrolase
LNVAYLQFAPVLGDPARNREQIRELLPRAAGAALVVLPELASSGYHFRDVEQARAASEPADGPTCALLRQLCGRHGFHVVCGLDERAGDALHNSAVVVGPSGLLAVYRKSHLFARETLFFRPGDQLLAPLEIAGARVGVLVCYDWFFPEAWTALMRAGADVVAHPANLVKTGLAQRAVPVMAMMHRFYVVTANRCGEEGDLRFTGRSLIAGPDGSLLAEAPVDGVALGVATLDLAAARDKTLTPFNDLLTDRRPDLYAKGATG